MNITLILAALALGTVDVNPLTTRWTFGAHEPYTMYRRVGRHCTGGIDGNARWLKPWLDWWDAESPKLMREIGLNALHSRFYKGMGWEEEKKDFPNVRKFVRNCHENGVMALAYVQFATLYPEVMRREIPDIDDWAQVDETGAKRYWNGQYFRWVPCMTSRPWLEYLKRMCTIALAEGGFDGIMFDNVFAAPCYCERCEREFGAHLRAIPDPAERFGFDSLAFVRQPRPALPDPETQDPVVREWQAWRAARILANMAELRAHIKSVKPDALVTGNPHPFRCEFAFAEKSLEMTAMADVFDVIIMQSANYPEVKANGHIVSRIRDLKIGQELGKTLVALCDSDAAMTEARERHYLLPMYEDLVLGGIPTDRTVIAPKPEPGFVSRKLVERRKASLRAFDAFVRDHRAALTAPSYRPVRLFWSPKTHVYSKSCRRGLVAAEEICIRNHIPYGYAISDPAKPFVAPAGTEVLVVPNCTVLSDLQVDGLVAWAERGGRLVVTGDAGRFDEWAAQRLENPLLKRLGALTGGNVVLREKPDVLPSAKLAWGYDIAAPADGGKALVADLAATGWKAPFAFEGVPETVFCEVKGSPAHWYFHFVNYAPANPARGVKVVLGGETVAVPDIVEYGFAEK